MALVDKLTADLDVADATEVSGAVSLIPDAIGSTDAVQATAGNRPTRGTANGNVTLIFDGAGDTLTWPRSTASNQTSPAAGVAFWFRGDNTTYTEIYNNAQDSSSGGRIYLTLSEEDPGAVALWVGVGGTAYRIGATAGSAWTVSTWTFLYVDYDGGQSAEADKLRIWLGTDTTNVAPASLTFSGDSAMPATLPQPADDFEIGNEQSIGAPYDGQIGAHLWCLDERLTEAEVIELMAIDPPVTLTGGDIEGSGALTAGAATLSGSGTVLVSGTGSLVAGAATVAATGSVLVSGTGALTAGAATLAGSGAVLVSGTGSLLAGAATLDGEGTVEGGDIEGSASLVAGAATLSGSGSVLVSGSGALVAGAATVDGSGTVGGADVAGTIVTRVTLDETATSRVTLRETARHLVTLRETVRTTIL